MLALVGTAVALPAQAVPDRVPVEVFVPGAGPLQDRTAYAAPSDDSPADAARRHAVAQLARAGVSPALLAAAQARGARSAVQAVPAEEGSTGVIVVSGGSAAVLPGALELAGDLDGDRRADVLDVRYAEQPDRTAVMALVARDARDGRVLWSKRVSVPRGGFVLPFPARTGVPARDGVVLLSFVFDGDGDTSRERLQLTGLAGRTGADLWRFADEGSTTFTDSGYSGESVPSVGGFVLGGTGPTQVLVTDDDFAFTDGPFGTTASGTVRPQLLDGATGRVRPAGEPVARDDAMPLVYVVGDTTGDRVDDVVVVASGADSEVALRTAEGRPVWSTGEVELQPGAYVAEVGPVLGSALPDLALLTGSTADELSQGVLGEVLPPTDPAPGSLVLLDGADGSATAPRTADAALPLGRAGAARVPAVASTLERVTRTADATEVELTTTATDAAGAVLWTSRLALRAGAEAFAYGFATPVGDLDADGAQELRVTVEAFEDEERTTRKALLDGRTGRVLQRAGTGLGGSLSSHGDDLVTVVAGKGVLLQGRSGRTGKPVFAVRLGAPTAFTGASATALPVRGPRCSDVAVLATGRADLAAMVSNQGRLRWSLTGRPGGLEVRRAKVEPVGKERCS